MSLIRTAARTAVASSVHGRVQRRQRSRWSTPVQAAHPEPVAAPMRETAPASDADPGDRLAQLKALGELRAGGVLTESEFEAEKNRILGT